MEGKGEGNNSSVKTGKAPTLFSISCTIARIPPILTTLKYSNTQHLDSSMTDCRSLPESQLYHGMGPESEKKHVVYINTFPSPAM